MIHPGNGSGLLSLGKNIYHLHFLRERDTPCHAGPHGEVPESVKKQKEQVESMAQSLYCVFHGEKMSKARCGNLSNFKIG